MSALACMLCGAAGSRELFLSILVIFLCMLGGTLLMLVATIVNGDFKNTHNRERPLEAEEEALVEEALAEEARRG
jgi:hypothetical protein